MSDKSDYEKKIGDIEVIPYDQVLIPYIPMDTYHQEAEFAVYQANNDKDQLIPAGFPVELLEDTPKRIGASREAQSRWISEVNVWKDAQIEWKDKAPQVYEFRDKLIHYFDFAYRHRKDLDKKISDIREGYGHDDMIQDVHDLGILGKQHPEPLLAVGFDLAWLDQALKLADEMGELLARSNGDRLSDHELKHLRDKAYTYLKEAVDEIRAYGKFVFWKDEYKLKLYSSAYTRRMNQRSRKPEEQEPMEDTPEET